MRLGGGAGFERSGERPGGVCPASDSAGLARGGEDVEMRGSGGFGSGSRRAAAWALALLAGGALGASQCDGGSGPPLPATGAALFTSPQANPVALSPDGSRLYVANTTSGTVSALDVSSPASPVLLAEIAVGLDPVSVAVRPPGGDGPEVVLASNHISDSVSVIDTGQLAVVQTVQALDAEGISTTDEPVGVAFAGPDRAFVALDHPNQVIVLDRQPDGTWALSATRLPITAQAPRAVAVEGGRLFVAAFESGNQTEFPSCSVDDLIDIDFDPGPQEVTGCGFHLEIVESFANGALVLGTLLEFATGPNIGGAVARNPDLPDRDLFVFDASTLALEQVIEGVGTLLYGVAGQGGRVYVTNTEARNQLNGLVPLDNRMFENRISYVDCDGGGCAGLTHVDLDASSLGVPVPTPYGVAASGDGSTLVVSVAGSDGVPGLHTDPATDIPGLVTLDANGNVLGAVQVGAIPQGLALASDGSGAPATAFVLNTVDSSLSVVDVSDPANPAILAGPVAVGQDPTPAVVREGRIAFSAARASTSGTFSCESCHPNGNMDQLLWSIDGLALLEIEPRTTMPVRGLRDTLPLHWDGVLADPFGGPNGAVGAQGDEAADCDLDADGELGCIRDLVNASLSAVMCRQTGTGCPSGPATNGDGIFLPGALDDAERDALAAFLASVAYPPSPKRRPDDELTRVDNGSLAFNDPAFVPNAIQGMSDFFTDLDGLGLGTTVGQAVGFAPVTCADNTGGCHSLPLTHSTNSPLVGGFDAPGLRGMWDRWILFSNGNMQSEKGMSMFQDCADGLTPVDFSVLEGDPCDIQRVEAGGFVLENPLPFPSGEEIWDPAVGPTERGAFLSSFEGIFTLVYGVPGASTWEYVEQMSVGLPGLTGRQLAIDATNHDDPEVVAALAQIEAAAADGKITAVARGAVLVAPLTFQPLIGGWLTQPGGVPFNAGLLRAAAQDGPITVTAHLPENISIGGPDRQPLLNVDPDGLQAEVDAFENDDTFVAPTLPVVPANGGPTVIRLGERYVEPEAKVLVNGAVCDACSLVSLLAPGTGEPAIDVTLPSLAAGVHAVQVQNPNGWASNELPVIAQ